MFPAVQGLFPATEGDGAVCPLCARPIGWVPPPSHIPLPAPMWTDAELAEQLRAGDRLPALLAAKPTAPAKPAPQGTRPRAPPEVPRTHRPWEQAGWREACASPRGA